MIKRQWISELRRMCPRVHCITNYVTAGYVADMVLAVGGSPIMAQGIKEVEDVTSVCHSLVLNIGTLEEGTIPSMISAAKMASRLSHPIILDPVGVTASWFRRESALKILRETSPSLIRGNESEINTLARSVKGCRTSNTCGVDSAGAKGDIGERLLAAEALRELTGAVVVMTGKEDIIAGNNKNFIIRNGHPLMARITGSGCMLDGVIGAFCALEAGRDNGFNGNRVDRECEADRRAGGRGYGTEREICIEDAAAAALCAHGLSGELAAEKVRLTERGTGSFRMYLTDFMSIMDDELLERGKKLEIQSKPSFNICGDRRSKD